LKRLFDIFVSIILGLILILPFLFLILIIKIENEGSVFYISKRLGKNRKVFNMYKFRTMQINTPEIHSNDLKNANSYITKVGKILRKYSLDELPQIINILKGEMTLVGPRPALQNQDKLILLREKKNIFSLVPGITGLAQINGRDNLTDEKKIEYETIYMQKKSFLLDLTILLKTISVVVKSKGIKH